MALVRRTPAGHYELRIRSRLLPKDAYFTFDIESDAQQFGKQCDELLAAGVVPAALLKEADKPLDTVARIVRAWRARGTLSAADDGVLDLVVDRLGSLRLDELTYHWAEQWLEELKRRDNLAPGTIRKRVGALNRAIDWYLRAHPDVQIANPLRLLPRGYATYTSADAKALQRSGKQVREDEERDRRLSATEQARIEQALAGGRRPDRERPLRIEPAFVLLYRLILGTGIRLREAYTLRRNQVGERTIRVQSSKRVDGAPAFRDVPLVRELRPLLAERVADMAPADLVFPWWDGNPETLPTVTSMLSRRFGTLFDYAGVCDMTEHDLRHEATCRWFEMRAPDGNWLFREQEVRRIMGWSARSPMPARYASFRAEDLADRL